MSFEIPGSLWKLTINPGAKKDPLSNPFAFCRDRGILGIGWGLKSEPEDAQDAEKLFRRDFGKNIRAFRAVVSKMDLGDHVWVYGERRFHVCRITSDWRHMSGPVWEDHDVRNVRDAEWKTVPTSLVPGSVKRRATMLGTCQRFRATRELRSYSGWLFQNSRELKEISKRLPYDGIREALEGADARKVLRDVLDPDDTEDVVGLYLQRRLGWSMLKSSTYRNKAEIECEFQRLVNGEPEVASMQVKSGDVRIDLQDYVDLAGAGEYVYLFATGDPSFRSEDLRHQHLIPLQVEEVFSFLTDQLELLPLPVVTRLGIWTGVIV